MKKSVIKYSSEIDDLVKNSKRKIGDERDGISESKLLAIAEDEFFNSRYINYVDIGHIKDVIDSIFKRISNRYGVLRDLLEDPSVNEIMVNGPHMIFVERLGEVIQVDDAFINCDELEDMIRMFASDVHREVNEANPIVDARLESGYRVNGVLKSVALNGPILTIRKFSNDPISISDLISNGSVSSECCDLLVKLVRSGYNIFISGGTSSGKTTFLNALSAAIDENERAIVIEDSAELRIDHLKNIVHMECRNANSIGKGEVSMEKLIRTSLRMRPDRIIVGEVRGKEVIDMIQAMNTGHDGSMSTGHGNSIKGMLSRLETMYLSGASVPVYSIKNQIANAIDIFVHLKRDGTGRRRVVEVAELVGFDEDEYRLNYLFTLDDNGKLLRTGNEIVVTDKLMRNGYGDIACRA